LLTLENILEMWKKDSVIDDNHLDTSSVEVVKLHAKYLEMLSVTKLKLKKTELNQKILLKDKWLYYNGKMTEDELKETGWEFDPFRGMKIMKGDMNRYYDSDIDIQQSEEKVVYFKTIVETLTEIVDTLRWRHQTISNIIKWKMFQAGG
jgi:hypothetical protein